LAPRQRCPFHKRLCVPGRRGSHPPKHVLASPGQLYWLESTESRHRRAMLAEVRIQVSGHSPRAPAACGTKSHLFRHSTIVLWCSASTWCASAAEKWSSGFLHARAGSAERGVQCMCPATKAPRQLSPTQGTHKSCSCGGSCPHLKGAHGWGATPACTQVPFARRSGQKNGIPGAHRSCPWS